MGQRIWQWNKGYGANFRFHLAFHDSAWLSISILPLHLVPSRKEPQPILSDCCWSCHHCKGIGKGWGYMECGKQVLPCRNFVIDDSARFPLWKSHLCGKTASIKVFPPLGNMTALTSTINPSLRGLCHSTYVDFAVTVLNFYWLRLWWIWHVQFKSDVWVHFWKLEHAVYLLRSLFQIALGSRR